MRLKGTKKLIKIKGGTMDDLKKNLKKLFMDDKDNYIDKIIDKLDELKNLDNRLINYIGIKKILKKEIKIDEFIFNIKHILNFLKDGMENDTLFDDLYNLFEPAIKKIYNITNDIEIFNKLQEILQSTKYFNILYDYVLSLINKNILKLPNNNVLEILKKNNLLKEKFLNLLPNIIDFNKINDIFISSRSTQEQSQQQSQEEVIEKANEEVKEHKKRKKSKYLNNSLTSFIVDTPENYKGPFFSSTSLYSEANAGDKQKIFLNIKNYTDELELSKERIANLERKYDEYNKLGLDEKNENIEYKKFQEEISKNNFNKSKDVINMTSKLFEYTVYNISRIINFVFKYIKGFIKTFGSIGQGIIIKVIIIIFIILSIIIGYKFHSAYNDANSMAFMNLNNNFFIYKDYNSFYNNLLEYLKGILPLNFLNGLNMINNNIAYITTGKNIYDNYLIDRESTNDGRCDNIFHIHNKNNNHTYCTIKPKDIILKYNENNNSDYNNLDNNLTNNLNLYNYYYIPVVNNPKSGKYVLDINNSTFNNFSVPNSNQIINNNLSKYKLFKSIDNNNNKITLNSFNNIHYDIKGHINNNPINTIESYSAYGIYLVNPNYNNINIAIIDISFNYDNFNVNLNDKLNKYILSNTNIYYIKINKAKPNHIFVSSDINNNEDDLSLLDFINTNNNISILKLYNQNHIEKYDLKYNIQELNINVIPPKLKYDDTYKRFYIDFVSENNKTSFLMMDAPIDGSINPIYEINISANNLNYQNDKNSDNYFLLFPSINDDSLKLINNKSSITDGELKDIILNFQNITVKQLNYTYYRDDNYIYPTLKRYGINIINLFFNQLANNRYYNKSITIKNNFNGLNTETITESETQNQIKTYTNNEFITYVFLLYFIINYFSRCLFYINLFGYNYSTDKSKYRNSYSIFLISNNDDGGNTTILGPKSGLGGQDYGEWTSNKIFKIDISKYLNIKTKSEYFKNKSIHSIGSSIIDFNNSSIQKYFSDNKDYIHQNYMNTTHMNYDKEFLAEKNFYFKIPSNFIGKLYSLVINKY